MLFGLHFVAVHVLTVEVFEHLRTSSLVALTGRRRMPGKPGGPGPDDPGLPFLKFTTVIAEILHGRYCVTVRRIAVLAILPVPWPPLPNITTV